MKLYERKFCIYVCVLIVAKYNLNVTQATLEALHGTMQRHTCYILLRRKYLNQNPILILSLWRQKRNPKPTWYFYFPSESVSLSYMRYRRFPSFIHVAHDACRFCLLFREMNMYGMTFGVSK